MTISSRVTVSVPLVLVLVLMLVAPAQAQNDTSSSGTGESHHVAAATGDPHATAPAAAATAEEDCETAPTFDPSTPRLELQVGGGATALFHTWRQSSDGFMAVGQHAEGLYTGGLFRAELAFALGGLSISAIYTHLFLEHDGTPDSVQMGLLSGEIGVQCACRGDIYVWSFGIEFGADLLNPNGTTVFGSIEHRSMFYLYEGLFVGFDIDIATFLGMTMNGPSGGGILGSLFLGYSLG